MQPPKIIPEIIIIAALCATNRVIGKNGKIPWHLPDDLARFKRLTQGHTVIVGRRTWEVDLERRPLPNRRHIIVSRSLSPDDLASVGEDRSLGMTVVRSLDEALAAVNGDATAFVIGGATLYAQTLNRADTLELTLVEEEYEGDAFFPEYESLIDSTFTLVNSSPQPGYCFNTYKRLS